MVFLTVLWLIVTSNFKNRPRYTHYSMPENVGSRAGLFPSQVMMPKHPRPFWMIFSKDPPSLAQQGRADQQSLAFLIQA